MSYRAAGLVLVFGLIATLLWRHELFTVQRPGDLPRDLVVIAEAGRRFTPVDAVLPAVPIGMRRVRAGDEVVLIHYWAPWQDAALAQATALDSLRRTPGLERLRIEVVCFDPFPSVARFIARNRLHLTVLLDHERSLAHLLPCPSVPYTYLLDRHGRIFVSQPGEVDWFAPETRAVLNSVVRDEANAPEGAL